MLIDDLFDESFIDPEVEDYINFLEADEQDNTGFLTKKRINEHAAKCLICSWYIQIDSSI